MTGRALSVPFGVNPKFGLIRIDIKHFIVVSIYCINNSFQGNTCLISKCIVGISMSVLNEIDYRIKYSISPPFVICITRKRLQLNMFTGDD